MSAISIRPGSRVNLPSHEIVMVTPQLARKWLMKNVRNRSLRAYSVSAYARDMKTGRWKFTGDAVKFALDGTLLDGQHRLAAIVEANVSVQMLVVYGLEAQTQEVMDTGRARTVGDVLSLRGEKNGAATASIARFAIHYENGSLPWVNRRPTHSELLDYIRRHPEIEDAATYYSLARSYVSANPSAIAAAFHICAEVDRADARDFFHRQLIEQTGMQNDDPALVLYRFLASRRNRGDNVSAPEALGYALLSWNAFRSGRTLTRLQAPKGGFTTETFPRAK
jgi:hypothetical protein